VNAMHLTESQLDDYLIGDLAPEAQSHLDACKHCQALLAEAAAPLANFREVTLAWAERRSATLPLVPAAKPSRATARLGWATAFAAALAIGVAVPVMHHAGVSSHPVAATETASTEQIARDNQMLSAIDNELNASTSSAATYGLQTTLTSEPSRTHVTKVQN